MARVLKAARNEPTQPVAELPSPSLSAISEHAKKYLEAVRHEAESILEETRRRCDEMILEAKSQAQRISDSQELTRASGSIEDASTTELKSTNPKNPTSDDMAAQLLAFHQSFENAASDWLRQWQNETVLLAIAIAEKLVRRQIQFDSDILVEWIQRAVELVQQHRRLIIQIHPETLTWIKAPLERFIEQVGETSHIEIAPCDTIEKIGAIVTTEDASIDVQLRTQLLRLEEELA